MNFGAAIGLMLYDTVLLRTFVAICDSGSFHEGGARGECHPARG